MDQRINPSEAVSPSTFPPTLDLAASKVAGTASAWDVPHVHTVTNPRWQFPRAGWLHALPRMDLNGVLWVGVPGPETLRTLARRSLRVGVACLSRKWVRATDAGKDPGLAGVDWLDWRRAHSDVTVPPWVELVVIAGPRGRRFMMREPGLGTLRAFTHRGGLVYTEGVGLRGIRAGDLESLRTIHGNVRTFRLLPLWGEAQAVMPASDSGMTDHVLRTRLAHPLLWSGLPGRVTRMLKWIPRRRAIGYRWGALIGGPAAEHADAPPDYLCRMARESGVSLDTYRWGLSIPDAYASRKLVFHLVGTAPSSPRYVAKMVSEPRFNERLENEARALRALEGMGLADGTRIPRVAFSGRHAGLEIVCESLIEGAGFGERSSGRPGCAHAESAIRTIQDLGRASRTAVTGAELASRLHAMLQRFRETYRDDLLGELLARHVAALERHPVPIPLVFLHGDAGIHNLKVTSEGHVAFLDWEAAEECGPPLWDLFNFLRSYGGFWARRTGLRSAGAGFDVAFLEESDFSAWTRGVITRYCREVGLTKSLVEPLFYLCWVHRSIKEATRIRDLERGIFVGALRRSMRAAARPSLSSLFAVEA